MKGLFRRSVQLCWTPLPRASRRSTANSSSTPRFYRRRRADVVVAAREANHRRHQSASARDGSDIFRQTIRRGRVDDSSAGYVAATQRAGDLELQMVASPIVVSRTRQRRPDDRRSAGLTPDELCVHRTWSDQIHAEVECRLHQLDRGRIGVLPAVPPIARTESPTATSRSPIRAAPTLPRASRWPPFIAAWTQDPSIAAPRAPIPDLAMHADATNVDALHRAASSSLYVAPFWESYCEP